MKKRIISLILCAALIISACGCSADNGTLSAGSSSTASAVSSAETVSQDTASSGSGSSSDTSSDASDKTSSDKQNSSSSDSSDKQNNSSADSSDKQNNSSDASSETSKPSTNKQESSSSAATSSKPANSTGSATSKPTNSAGTATNKPASATAADTTKKPAATTTSKKPTTTTTTTVNQTSDKPLSFSETYEAENGKLSNDMSVISDSNASGGKSVGKFESDSSYCQISITVPADAVYDIVIRSKAIGPYKENDLYADGKKAGTFVSKPDNFSDYTVCAVTLKKGSHTLTVKKSWGWIELDKITVKTGAKISNSTYNVTSTLVNRNATANTKKLYSFLKDSYGKYVITGQQCDGGINGNEFKAIKNLTGDYPALLGLDMMDYTPSRTALGTSSSAVDKAIEFHKKGGIVTFCWHWNAPTEYLYSTANSSDGWWGGFYTKSSKFDIAKVMNGQDAKGKKLLDRDIKEIAKQLKRLEKAGVPVIWRPLHEASGGWFWWGAQGPDAYKKLWKYLYKELTNTYGCNNLIWVYNGQSADWYPGDEYVDIVGEDIYPGNHVYDPQVSRFKQAINYGSKTKITALTENGCIFDIDSAVSINALWCWFMTWGDEFTVNGSNYSEKYTEKSVIKKMYASKYSLTLGSLPKIY
ncbi:MAG: beta-mannanase [Ruminiclostridium sp.]|nr:beta-mannanase [Ruminiclostridium sp.]